MVNVRKIFQDTKAKFNEYKEKRKEYVKGKYKQRAVELKDLHKRRLELKERNRLNEQLSKEKKLYREERINASPIGKLKKGLKEFKKYKSESQSRSPFLNNTSSPFTGGVFTPDKKPQEKKGKRITIYVK